jgi:hypothetical protein
MFTSISDKDKEEIRLFVERENEKLTRYLDLPLLVVPPLK